MQEYKVKIIERLSTVVTVHAENADDAEDRVRSMYRNSDVVLTSDDYVDTDFSVIDQESYGNAGSQIGRKSACSKFENAPPAPKHGYSRRPCGRAYDKLTNLLYALEQLLGDRFDVETWVDELDRVACGDVY